MIVLFFDISFFFYFLFEFIDAETAASAVRNLNDYDIGGRQIRVDYAAMDPHLDQRHNKQQPVNYFYNQ